MAGQLDLRHLDAETLAGALSDGLVLLTADGKIADVSPGFCEMTGWSRLDLVGGAPPFPFWPEDERQRLEQLLLADPASNPLGEHELMYVRRDGGRFPVVVRVAPLRDPDGRITVLVHVVRDASSRNRRFREQLVRTQRLDSLGVLAGGIGHELNSLLMAISGNAALARMDLEAGSPVLYSIDQIDVAARSATELARDLLALSGGGRATVRWIDVGRFIGDVRGILQMSAGKGPELRIDPASALPPVKGNPIDLRQAILNLVTNAAEAIGNAAGTITVACHGERLTGPLSGFVRPRPDLPAGNYVVIEIRDTGSGMTPDALARAFDPDFGSMRQPGRGLGLAATVEIVGSHGGAIQVSSEPGHGSRFRMFLPTAPNVATES